MGGVPSQQVLGAGLVEEELRCSNSGQGLWIIRNILQIGQVIAVFLPGDEIFGDPEINVGLIIATVAHQVISFVVAFDDAGMPTIFFTDPLAAVEDFPMQSIQADAVVKTLIIPLHHVSEKVGLVFRHFPGRYLSRRIGHLGLAGCRP